MDFLYLRQMDRWPNGCKGGIEYTDNPSPTWVATFLRRYGKQNYNIHSTPYNSLIHLIFGFADLSPYSVRSKRNSIYTQLLTMVQYRYSSAMMNCENAFACQLQLEHISNILDALTVLRLDIINY